MYKKLILVLTLSLILSGILTAQEEEAKEININNYKEEMLEGLKNPEELFDMTKGFYNDPDMADIFLEAYFNNTDFPDMEKDIRINVDEKTYKERSEAYKAIRNKKYLLSSTTVLFKEYGSINEYPTGGFLSKKDYNKDIQEFEKSWLDVDLWSKYRWRVKGNRHESSMVMMDGSIRIEIPSSEEKDLTGDHILFRTKKATFMAVFKIKEKGKDYLLIEPVRYMIVWRRKGKVYSNFEASFEQKASAPAAEKKADDDAKKKDTSK